MTFSPALRSRDPLAAARSSRLGLLFGAGVLACLTVTRVSGAGAAVLSVHWLGVLVLVVGAVACTVVPPEQFDRLGMGVAIAAAGIVVVCTLDLLTSGTSTAGQAFLALPVLWSAVHLRPVGVAVVTGLALAGDAVTSFVLVHPGPALTDVVLFGAVLVVMAVTITRVGLVQERLVTALREQARVDALTGLVNRRAFDDALTSTMNRPVRGGTALVLIDVDEFKTINDSHGHPVGDAALVHLAGVLREHVRAEDAVVSRLGGDELAVLLPDCGPAVAARRAEELLDAVRGAPLPLTDGTLLALSISVGVAHVPVRSGDREQLYHSADAALYAAKRAGRGQVAVAGR